MKKSFITFMDALNLRLRAKDQLHPILQALVTGYASLRGARIGKGEARWFLGTTFLFFHRRLPIHPNTSNQAYHPE